MTESARSASVGLSATTFFSKTYDEALALVVEARDYVRDGAVAESRYLAPDLRILLSCETMRLTTRLTEVMAWLLTQRARHEGEITAAQARNEGSCLGAPELCLAGHGDRLGYLPPRLESLMERSERLYRRVQRLDELVRRDLG
jgi:regulator of CtrA degradation